MNYILQNIKFVQVSMEGIRNDLLIQFISHLSRDYPSSRWLTIEQKKVVRLKCIVFIEFFCFLLIKNPV